MKTTSRQNKPPCQPAGKDFFDKKDESLIFQFHHIHNAMFRVANKIINASSVPVKMEQLPVMMTLYWFKKQSQQQVADHLNRDKSSVLRTVKVLEKKGLVANKRDRVDGRRKVLTLTETGLFVATQVVGLIEEIENEIAGALTDLPKPELIKSLKKSIEKLELLTNG